MAKSKVNKYSGIREINIWLMLRDVLQAAINKGQGIPIMIGMIFLIMMIKMPGKDVATLAFKIFDAIIDLSLVGLIIGVSTGLGWFIQVNGSGIDLIY